MRVLKSTATLGVLLLTLMTMTTTTQAQASDPGMNIAMNIIRPIYKNLEFAALGNLNGFLGIDVSTPAYCFTDGIKSIVAAYELVVQMFNKGKLDYNIWINV